MKGRCGCEKAGEGGRGRGRDLSSKAWTNGFQCCSCAGCWPALHLKLKCGCVECNRGRDLQLLAARGQRARVMLRLMMYVSDVCVT